MTGYELSRIWFDWCFINPDKVKPGHTALYFFCIEHCNRLGWKDKFGLPTAMAKEALGIHSYNTFINTLNDLVEFGFILMVQKSKNQYSSNIIALSNFDKAPDKALDEALIKHMTKQSESTVQSIDSIIKQLTNNKEQLTNKHREELRSIIAIEKPKKKKIEERENDFYESVSKHVNDYDKQTLRNFFDYWSEKTPGGEKMKFELEKTFEVAKRLATWKRNNSKYERNAKSTNNTEWVKRQAAVADLGEEARKIVGKWWRAKTCPKRSIRSRQRYWH